MKRTELIDKIQNVYKSCNTLVQLPIAEEYCVMLLERTIPLNQGDDIEDRGEVMDFEGVCYIEAIERICKDEE